MMKVILVGRLSSKNMNNGPGAILFQLQESLPLENVDLVCAFFANDFNSKIKALKKFVAEIVTSSPMVVNVHTDGFLVPLFVWFCSKIERKHNYYLAFHGNCEEECKYLTVGCKKKRYIALENFLYHRFDNAIFVSCMQAHDFEKKLSRKKPVFVVENGTAASMMKRLISQKMITNNEIRLISLGGVNRRKGINSLLLLADYLSRHLLERVTIDIYGMIQDQDVWQEYETLLCQLKLEKTVRFCGRIEGKDAVYRKLEEYDFSCCLSLYDTFNVAVVESMAMGTPVICSTKCGAVDYIQDGVNGLIFDIDDAEESMRKIADALKKCQLEKAYYNTLVCEAVKIREHTTPQKMVDKYIDAFHARTF